MGKIEIDAVELLSIIGKVQAIVQDSRVMYETGLSEYLEKVEKNADSVNQVILQATADQFGKVEV